MYRMAISVAAGVALTRPSPRMSAPSSATRGGHSFVRHTAAALYMANRFVHCPTPVRRHTHPSTCKHSPSNKPPGQDSSHVWDFDTLQMYCTDRAFEEPTMQMILDGDDMDYKQQLRHLLLRIVPPQPTNFTYTATPTGPAYSSRATEHKETNRTQTAEDVLCENNAAAHDAHTHARQLHQQTAHMLRVLCAHGVISYAQIRSTPTRFAALYETLASADLALALLAVSHFSFATCVATHVTASSLRSTILADADAGTHRGCVAEPEQTAHPSAPLSTEAHYDATVRRFVLSGQSKMAIIGAASAEWALVAATLVLPESGIPVRAASAPTSALAAAAASMAHRSEAVYRAYSGRDEIDEDDTESAGVHWFVVRLREQGVLCRGVRVAALTAQTNVELARAGAAVVHFDRVILAVDHMLLPYCICHDEMYGDEARQSPLDHNSRAGHDANAANHHGMECKHTDDNRYDRTSEKKDVYRTSSANTRDGSVHHSSRDSNRSHTPRRCRITCRLAPSSTGTTDTRAHHRTRARLATGSLCVGMMKRLVTEAVHYTATTAHSGPETHKSQHETGHNFPYLGIQPVQTALVTQLAAVVAHIIAWHDIVHRCSRDMDTDTTTTTNNSSSSRNRSTSSSDCYSNGDDVYKASTDQPASTRSNTAQTSSSWRVGNVEVEHEVQLAGMVYMLQQTVQSLLDYGHRYMDIHAVLHPYRCAVQTALQIGHEAHDYAALIRRVAQLSVRYGIGTTHWGWRATSLLRWVPWLDRLVSNPLYSARMAELARHYLFFGHKHHRLRCRLRGSQASLRGQHEQRWYDWNTFRHEEVLHCGEAYMEMYTLERMMCTVAQCADLRGRKVLRDVAWIYALARQRERQDFLLLARLMSARAAEVLRGHLDNLATVAAPQCVHVVQAMRVHSTWLSPCAWSYHRRRAYWSIPGTKAHADAIQSQHDSDSGNVDCSSESDCVSDAKAREEMIREEDEEWDLLHGLADKQP